MKTRNPVKFIITEPWGTDPRPSRYLFCLGIPLTSVQVPLTMCPGSVTPCRVYVTPVPLSDQLTPKFECL